MNKPAPNLIKFMPSPIRCRADLIPILLEVHAELDRIGAHLAAAFASCDSPPHQSGEGLS